MLPVTMTKTMPAAKNACYRHLTEKIGDILGSQIRAIGRKEKDRPNADQRQQNRIRLRIET